MVLLGASALRADDPANPPPAPTTPNNPAAPADGDQPAPPPGHHRGMRPMGYSLDDLTQKLTLSADQQKTVGSIIDNGSTQAKAVRGDDSLSREDKRSKLQTIFKTEHDDIRAVLNTDQQKIFDAMPAPGARHRKPDGN